MHEYTKNSLSWTAWYGLSIAQFIYTNMSTPHTPSASKVQNQKIYMILFIDNRYHTCRPKENGYISPEWDAENKNWYCDAVSYNLIFHVSRSRVAQNWVAKYTFLCYMYTILVFIFLNRCESSVFMLKTSRIKSTRATFNWLKCPWWQSMLTISKLSRAYVLAENYFDDKMRHCITSVNNMC